ncbi:MAG: DUF1566 domain-containing protein [Chlorobi bacterium]|nr:DUF1566 domain-containing protein [Chlorobiota bacterium]
MKKLLTVLCAIFLIANIMAQPPQKLSYQAVIRDGSNELVINQGIGMQISILQGSASGTEAFKEMYNPNPQTNSNGLVTIEIGTGIPLIGTFELIDWANGPYFLKTETDPNGGTDYTIVGTSELLSVPYALYAETAQNITGGELDPVFSASVASGITATDTAYWNNKQDQLTAGSGIEITNDTISATTYAIGDFVNGGVVFWVDESGQHGLVCAKENQGTGVRWYAGGAYANTMAFGDGPLSGNMNTMLIIADQGLGDGNTYAAYVCSILVITEESITYGDWYLPSKEELNLIYQNKEAINTTALAHGGTNFPNYIFWSSTEQPNAIYAWAQYFYDGSQVNGAKNSVYWIRAIRAF